MNANNGHIVRRFSTKDGDEAIIRYLQLEDVEAMRHFVNAISREDTFIRLSGEQLSSAEEEEFVTEKLTAIENRDSVYLLCFVKGKLAGTFSASRNTHARKRERHIATLGLLVGEKERSKGIGKILMETGIHEAKRKIPGLRLFTLTVFATNEVARNLYAKLGFREYGRLPDGIKYRGTFVDHVEMYLRI